MVRGQRGGMTVATGTARSWAMRDPTHQNAETALYSVRSRKPWKMLREGSAPWRLTEMGANQFGELRVC